MFKKILLSLLLLTTVLNATAPTQGNIVKLYIATFNRAPDAAGLNYWSTSGISIESMAKYFFNSTEVQVIYPPGSTTGDFVEAVYENLFNRASDPGGFTYWVEEIDSGRLDRSNVILAVIKTDTPNDAMILENKTVVALAFVEKLGAKSNITSGDLASDPSYLASIKIISEVTEDRATVECPVDFLESIVNDDDPIGRIIDDLSCSNGVPTANNDSATAPYNTSVLVDVLANDIDSESSVSLTGFIINEIGGTFVQEGTQIRFTPTDGFEGTASAVYEIEDVEGLTDTATVTVEVGAAPPPTNTPPTCDDFTVDTMFVNTFTTDLTPHISDADGDSLTGVYVGSGVSFGDIVIDNAKTSVSGTDATIAVTSGTVSGSFSDLKAIDEIYETITERLSGGEPSKRYSYLEHVWTIQVESGVTMTLFTHLLPSNSTDGDEFKFAYSMDNNNYIPMFTTSGSSVMEYSANLPASISGTLYIRVTDTDRTEGNKTLDSIAVDQLYIRTGF